MEREDSRTATPLSIVTTKNAVLVSTGSPANIHLYNSTDLRDGKLFDISTMMGSLSVQLHSNTAPANVKHGSVVAVHALEGAFLHLVDTNNNHIQEITMPAEFFGQSLAASPWMTASRGITQRSNVRAGSIAPDGAMPLFTDRALLVVASPAEISPSSTVEAYEFLIPEEIKGRVTNAWALDANRLIIEISDGIQKQLNYVKMNNINNLGSLFVIRLPDEFGQVRDIHYDQNKDNIIFRTVSLPRTELATDGHEGEYSFDHCYVLSGMSSMDYHGQPNLSLAVRHFDDFVNLVPVSERPAAVSSLYSAKHNLLVCVNNRPCGVEVTNFSTSETYNIMFQSKDNHNTPSEMNDRIVSACFDETRGSDSAASIMCLYATGEVKSIDLSLCVHSTSNEEYDDMHDSDKSAVGEDVTHHDALIHDFASILDSNENGVLTLFNSSSVGSEVLTLRDEVGNIKDAISSEGGSLQDSGGYGASNHDGGEGRGGNVNGGQGGGGGGGTNSTFILKLYNNEQ